MSSKFQKTTAQETPFITFSARGLLLHDTPSFEKWCFSYLYAKNPKLTEAEFRKVLLAEWRALPERLEERPSRSHAEVLVIESLVNRLHPGGAEDAIAAYKSSPTKIVIPRETFECLEVLRNRSYRLAVVSNEGAELVGVFRVHQLLDFFEFILTADDVASPKPSKDIFALALEEFGAQAVQAKHVGDRFAFDVIGPKALGMGCLLYDPHGYERDLFGAGTEISGKVVSLLEHRLAKNLEGVVRFEKASEVLEIFK